MSGQQTIALVGDSILIAGVAISLGRTPGVQVIHIDPDMEGLHERLSDIQPKLIVAETDSRWAHRLLEYLLQQPNLQFAGIDNVNGCLILVSSRHYATPSLDALVHTVIEPLIREVAR